MKKVFLLCISLFCFCCSHLTASDNHYQRSQVCIENISYNCESNGDLIIEIALTDGTAWIWKPPISLEDHLEDWEVGDRIGILRMSKASYGKYMMGFINYCHFDLRDPKVVIVKCTPETRKCLLSLVSFDSSNGELILSDGSKWVATWLSQFCMSSWKEGDLIHVGRNGFICDTCHTIYNVSKASWEEGEISAYYVGE